MPTGSDASLSERLRAGGVSGMHPSFQSLSIPRTRKGAFTVQHYAGAVTYSTEGFLEKSRDLTGSTALASLTVRCGAAFIASLFAPATECVSPKGTVAKRPPPPRGESTGSQFRKQLTGLVQSLAETEPHFVR